MLAQTLRQFEQDGLLSRTVRPKNPSDVEYALTRFSESLLVPVSELVCWAKRNHRRVRWACRHYVPPG